ncbi:MAG: glycosyltransferase family 2 protein [Rhizomicrobium sp.]
MSPSEHVSTSGTRSPDSGGPLPVVSIIVVSYGTREMTLACLRSVVAETRDAGYEVIVVDNASKDGSAEAIAAQFPDFLLLAQTANLGFAAANNLAAERARGRYLLLLNPDTVVLDRAVDELVAFARRRPQARIWGGRTLFGDGTLNPTSCWRRQTLWNLLCRSVGLAKAFPDSPVFHSEAYGGWTRDSEREVDIVTGCFLMIETETWRRLRGFAPEFFMYGEDADLCLRARADGARPAITPEATIVHYGGATERDNARKNKRLLAAKALLIRRHLSRPIQPLALALLALRPAIMRLLFGRRDAVWRDVWRARQTWMLGKFESN